MEDLAGTNKKSRSCDMKWPPYGAWLRVLSLRFLQVDVPMALYGNIPMITAVHRGLDGGLVNLKKPRVLAFD